MLYRVLVFLYPGDYGSYNTMQEHIDTHAAAGRCSISDLKMLAEIYFAEKLEGLDNAVIPHDVVKNMYFRLPDSQGLRERLVRFVLAQLPHWTSKQDFSNSRLLMRETPQLVMDLIEARVKWRLKKVHPF